MIITLLSDSGTKDATVALMKAAFRQRLPEAVVVDISHEVARQSQRQAAYMLGTYYNNFPKGTVHVLPVSVFAGKNPCMILCERDEHFFVVPDNGMMPLAFGGISGYTCRLCHEYDKPYSFAKWIEDAAKIAEMIQGGGGLPDAGFMPQTLKEVPRPINTYTGIECHVLYTDRYENVVLNMNRDEWSELIGDRTFSIKTLKGGGISRLSMQYNDVAAGEPLCRFNTVGLLEIAVNHGSAMEVLGIDKEGAANLRYDPVRIVV